MGKRIISLLLAVIMVVSVSACGKKESVEVKSSKDFVYRVDDIKIGDQYEDESLWDFFISGGRLIITSSKYTDQGSEFKIRNMNLDGTDPKEVGISLTTDQYINNVIIGKDGKIHMILNETSVDQTDPNNEIWRNELYLVVMDQNGSELIRQKLNKDDNYNLMQFNVLDDGSYLMYENEGIASYDASGNFQKLLISTTEKDLGINTIFVAEDGSVILLRYDYEASLSVMNKLDVTNATLSEDKVLPEEIRNATFYKGAGCDFFVADSSSIYSYNFGDEKAQMLMNYIDSDLDATYVSKVCGTSKDALYGKIVDSLTGKEVIMSFTKIPPEQVVDKQVLTLAGIYIMDDYRIRSAVVKYNKTNPKYRIRLKDYSQYNTDQDYEAGMARLNTDIASGVVPDILVLSGAYSMSSYENKGVFEDLYPYIDNDPEIDRKDYFENVLDAYANKGKLYRLSPAFNVFSVLGKTSQVGEKEGWTFEEFRAYVESMPEDSRIFESMTRGNLLQYAMNLSSSQYINWETGECNFRSPSFIYLLELAKTFPATWEEMDHDVAREYSADDYRNGKILLFTTYLSDFKAYNEIKKITFGEDVTFIGFPTDNGKGTVIQSDNLYSMSAKSNHKEGIWQFIRQTLLDDFQNTITYSWPLSLKYIQKQAEDAMKEETTTDGDGNVVPYQPMIFDGVSEIPVPPVTQVEIDEVMEVLKGVDQIYYNNQELFHIIEEEAAPYFAGQKDVKAVVDIIQSRVQIYVNENR